MRYSLLTAACVMLIGNAQADPLRYYMAPPVRSVYQQYAQPMRTAYFAAATPTPLYVPQPVVQQYVPQPIPQPVEVRPQVIEQPKPEPEKVYIYVKVPEEKQPEPQLEPRDAYIKECQRYGFKKSKCEHIWDDEPEDVAMNEPQKTIVIKHNDPVLEKKPEPYQENGATITPIPDSKLEIISSKDNPKLLDIDNQEYKQRREETLKESNAVVGHMTLR